MVQVLKLMFPYLRPFWKQSLIAVLLALPLSAIKAYEAYLVKDVFDKGFAPGSPPEEAWRLAAILVGLGILNYPLRYFHYFGLRMVVDRCTCTIRRQLFLMCLYLEMVMKTAVSFNPQDQHSHSQEHAGLFAVLSNALFHLDQALAEQNFHWRSHLLLFLSKFLHHLGVMPDESSCVFCGNALEGDVIAPLVQEQGGFACQDCVREANISTHNPLPVRPLLARAVRTSFKDWRDIPEVPAPVNVQLMQFWSYHLHVKLPELASYRLLF